MPEIIKHPDTYKCKIRNHEYRLEQFAIWCESQPFDIDKYKNIKIGQHVLVQTRYGGKQKDVIKDISIGCRIFQSEREYKEDSDLDQKCTGRFKGTHREFHNQCPPSEHFLKITTEEEWEICKDGTCTNEWDVESLELI
jgi:hypothetical protein